MTIFLSADEVREYEKLKILSQLALVKEKLKLFETKNGKPFKEFEKEVKEKEENFEKWDEYIEWKAYKETEKTLTNKMAEIDNVQDIEIT
jgi:hypothetical protein